MRGKKVAVTLTVRKNSSEQINRPHVLYNELRNSNLTRHDKLVTKAASSQTSPQLTELLSLSVKLIAEPNFTLRI